MCRLLGWAGRRPATLADVLGEDDLDAFTGLSAHHGDGWGVARSTARGVSVRRRPDAARTSARFDRWARHRRTDLGLAHLRRATLGLSIGPANTHPFTDGRVAFAHNGSISPPAALDDLLLARSQHRRRGTTDSERYFLALLTRLRSGTAPRDALRDTVDEIAGTLPFTSLNCLLLTPDELIAACHYDPAGDLEDKDPDYYRLRYRVTDDAVVVSSSGWGRNWQELANGDLLTVRRGSLETEVLSGVELATAR
jgi:predicted glutamine amidotransferase